ncbi:hypothetical protein [Herbaspirillum sp. ST 5-3]|uniref:hypothetical protein n=1 Tax=Oxalobacteraceae TaxID=75682 RepID=UPI0010A3B912|nr:hypothetical protein [Herbaspirillum sp. ST 5-3]
MQSSEKVDISRILIHPSDGSASSARVTSIEAANSVLQNWAHDASGMCQNECEVEIIFEDGLRYSGHYPLTKHEKRVSLSRHVRRQLTALAKTACIKRGQAPANEPILSPNEADPAECAKTVLEHYNI